MNSIVTGIQGRSLRGSHVPLKTERAPEEGRLAVRKSDDPPLPLVQAAAEVWLFRRLKWI
jgi:hypothetical protein